MIDDPRIAAFEAKGRLAAVRLMGTGDRDFDDGEALRVTGWGWMGQRNESDTVSRMDSAKRLQRNPADLQAWRHRGRRRNHRDESHQVDQQLAVWNYRTEHKRPAD